MGFKRLWIALAAVMTASFIVLGYFGVQLYFHKPPIPARVVTPSGQVLFTEADVRDGQNVWQSIGGQEVGSVWGHGAYIAPDWSADWLHREATWLANYYAEDAYALGYEALDVGQRASVEARVQEALRTNTYDSATGDVVVGEPRADAIEAVADHYVGLFGSDVSLNELRDAYAIAPDAIPDPERRRLLTAFFFWASWSCSTERPGKEITYTNNWPPDELVGNRPTTAILLWSIVSVFLLLAGIGALAWYFAVQRHAPEEDSDIPATDPLLGLQPTPSMRATLKYFWIVTAMFVAQIGFGAVTAHYGVEGTGFYGIPIAEWLPQAVSRTWHTQLGIFWIATAWIATGLFIAPAVSGKEPWGQRLGTNVLFGALLLVVVGSMVGEWLGVQQKLGFVANFWFGHQGYEYVDLGRVWQILLFVGLVLWLVLMLRALWPALRTPGEGRHLLFLFVIASAAIAFFYSAGLMWGRQTHLAIAEYWRWWVVHLHEFRSSRAFTAFLISK